MKQNLSDTIAAIATPIGEGGISVIRVSGDITFNILSKIFFTDKDGLKHFDFQLSQSHTIHFGFITENSEVIDEVLISVFKNPTSYTGEDVAEISCHGGVYITRRILGILLKLGARLAEAGEFTKRAFINGKIDLSQAEAVADLINAQTDKAHNSSIKQLEGSLSDFVTATRQELIDLTSLIELELDFAEEGLELVDKNELMEKFISLKKRLEAIVDSYIAGKVIREGVNLVIAGKPNSGKSSLFNELLKTNRAIVSDIEGTTRDYLQESLIIKGYLFNLIDTAGLRFAEDIIESEGIKRSLDKINEADLVLYLIDSTKALNEIQNEINDVRGIINSEKLLITLSKSDLISDNFDIAELQFSISDDKSIQELKQKMVDIISREIMIGNSSDITLTNIRHKVCLENVIFSLQKAVESISKNMSGEFISVDFRNAMSYLGEITGEVTNEELLANIFGKFCIGK